MANKAFEHAAGTSPKSAPSATTVNGANRAISPLEKMTRLLGEDVFFVPCKWGTKEPRVKYAKRAFESTKTKTYRAKFNKMPTNIAVYLGKASGGLCTIDLDSDADKAKFDALNPKLRFTTQSRGSRGGMFWVRIQGDYPGSCNPSHKHFEWRADDRLSTIYGRHPAGMDYQLVCEAPPVVISFAEIIWPEEWGLPWKMAAAEALRQQYGEPFYLNDKGSIAKINESYWAGLHAHEHTLLYEPDENAFYVYNAETGLYEPESADAIRTKLSGRLLEASRQADAFDLQKHRGASTLNGVISHVRGIVEHRGAFTEKKRVIHVANGVIVFNGAEADLHPFSPEFRSRHRSPIVFNEKATCERFLNELILPAVRADDVQLLQKVFGMFLLGYNRAQRIVILDGLGGRGKTQLAIVAQGLVGNPNCTQLRTKHLAERFEIFRFLKKTLLVGVDVEADFLSTKGAAVLKGLVGGDWFDAEQKGGTGSFQMQGMLNVLITSNARLRVRLQGDVSAWKRRLIIVRYEAPPPNKVIPDFGEFLVRTEGSGILNWALLGAQQLLNEIPDAGGDFKMTQSQRDIVDSLLAESDSLRHFLAERVEKHEEADVTTQELVEAYAVYCPERGWKAMPVTEVHQQLEGSMLELFGVTKSHDIKRNDKNQRGFSRVRIKPSEGAAAGRSNI